MQRFFAAGQRTRPHMSNGNLLPAADESKGNQSAPVMISVPNRVIRTASRRIRRTFSTVAGQRIQQAGRHLVLNLIALVHKHPDAFVSGSLSCAKSSFCALNTLVSVQGIHRAREPGSEPVDQGGLALLVFGKLMLSIHLLVPSKCSAIRPQQRRTVMTDAFFRSRHTPRFQQFRAIVDTPTVFKHHQRLDVARPQQVSVGQVNSGSGPVAAQWTRSRWSKFTNEIRAIS